MPKRSPTSDFFYFLMFASTLRTKYLSQSEKALVCIEKLEAMVINRDVLAGLWGCYRGGLGGLLVGSKICYKFSCVVLSFRHPRRLRGGSSRARAAVPPMCSPCLSRARSRSTRRWGYQRTNAQNTQANAHTNTQTNAHTLSHTLARTHHSVRAAISVAIDWEDHSDRQSHRYVVYTLVVYWL